MTTVPCDELLAGRSLRVRGVDWILVHWTARDGDLAVLLRQGDADVLLAVRPGPPDPGAFLSADGFNARYECHPRDAAFDSDRQRSLQDVVRQFLARLGPRLRPAAPTRPVRACMGDLPGDL